MPEAQVTAVLVCDDIRKEINFKDILIGVYTGEIIVHSLPLITRLAFWVELEVKRPGPFSMFLKIEAPGPNPFFEMKLDTTINNAKISTALYTPQVPIPIDREGILKVSAKFSELGRYEIIKERIIRYMPPYAPPQPPVADTTPSPGLPRKPSVRTKPFPTV
jgi:hypothetical protein